MRDIAPGLQPLEDIDMTTHQTDVEARKSWPSASPTTDTLLAVLGGRCSLCCSFPLRALRVVYLPGVGARPLCEACAGTPSRAA